MVHHRAKRAKQAEASWDSTPLGYVPDYELDGHATNGVKGASCNPVAEISKSRLARVHRDDVSVDMPWGQWRCLHRLFRSMETPPTALLPEWSAA